MQLVNLLLPPNSDRFTWVHRLKHFFVISLKRLVRMREKMDQGNWELHLSGSKDRVGDVIKLIDDSQSTTNPQGVLVVEFSMLLVVQYQVVHQILK